MASSEAAKLNDTSEAAAKASAPPVGAESKTGAEAAGGTTALAAEPTAAKPKTKTKSGKVDQTTVAASPKAKVETAIKEPPKATTRKADKRNVADVKKEDATVAARAKTGSKPAPPKRQPPPSRRRY